MTIETQTPRIVFVGTGTRGPFQLQDGSGNPIRLRVATDLVVWRYASVTDNDGEQLVKDVDFTVSNVDPDNATFSLTMAQDVLASGERLVVTRSQDVAQNLNLTLGGNYGGPSDMAQRDIVAEQIQELRRDVDRSVKNAWTESEGVSLPIPASATQPLAQTADGELVHYTAPALAAISAGYLVGEELQAPGDGVETVFVLTGIGATNPRHLDIQIDITGNQPWDTYSVYYDSGTSQSTVTFDSPPPYGSTIYFRPRVYPGMEGPAGPSLTLSAQYRIPARVSAGPGASEEITSSANVFTFLGAANYAAMRTQLGLGTGDSPQFTTIELGAATDTTLARVAAGRVSIEGHEIATLDQTQTFTGTKTWSALGTFSLASTASGQPSLTVSSTDPGSVGATLRLLHSSASPAANDLVARIIFDGVDSGAGGVTYARIQVDAIDPTDTAETGRFGVQTMQAGAITTRWYTGLGLYSQTVTGGDKGINTLNFQTIYQNNVQVATLGANAFAAAQTVSVAGLPLRLTNTTDAAANQGLIIESDRATPTAGDQVYASWVLSDSAGNQDEMGRLALVTSSVTNGAESGYLLHSVRNAGSLTQTMRMTSTVLSPHVSDGVALGSTSLMWSDLFLASGGVINFNNGDVTITHGANTLTFAGAASGYSFDVVPTVSGVNLVTRTSTDTLTNKTLTSPVLNTGVSGTALAAATDVRAQSSTTLLLTPASLAQKAAFAAHKNGTNQTGIASTVWTKITFSTELYDVGAGFDAVTNSRWTPPASVVRLGASVEIDGTLASPGQLLIAIYKNGSEWARGGPATTAGTSFSYLAIHADDLANGTDYYEIWVNITTSSGTATANGTAAYTRFYGSQV